VRAHPREAKKQKKKKTQKRSFIFLLNAKARRENGVAFCPKTRYLAMAFGLKGKARQWALKPLAACFPFRI
jgi:hypothetical protein